VVAQRSKDDQQLAGKAHPDDLRRRVALDQPLRGRIHRGEEQDRGDHQKDAARSGGGFGLHRAGR
jgi:hypothetical protein